MIGPGLSVVLFSAAVWLLHRQLQTYHLNDIMASLQAIPNDRLYLALGLTLASYGAMTGYDALALHYIRHPLAYRKIGLASFIGYAFSNNIGLSMIAGASVRYRLYSAWGLSTIEITQMVVFCTLSVWLGFLNLGGLMFLIDPLIVPPALHLPFTTVRPLGGLLLAVVAVCGVVIFLKKTPLKIRAWEFRLPSTTTFGWQLLTATADWVLAGAVLYVLIARNTDLSFVGFLGAFMLAQLSGMVSQIPGGLGVFETVVVLLLSQRLPIPQILGALLAYRALYYWIPLVAAALLLAIQEVLRKRRAARRIAELFEQWVSPVIPQVLAVTVFAGGAILLLSGATPVIGHRLEHLRHYLPLPFLELSHFAGSLAGMGLLLLARGLQRRLDAAYVFTVTLLIIGITASILKGLDYEEALTLLAILVAVLPARRHFYRKASLFSQRFNAGWIAAIFIVLSCSIWLGFYAYRHVEYADSLWWRFTFGDNASRFLRGTVGAVVVGLFFALARLLRAAPPSRKPAQEDMAAVERVVRHSPATSAYLALLGDKYFLVHPSGDAFSLYGIEGRSWIAMGDPVGPTEVWSELIWLFRELSDRYGGWTVFYEVGYEHLHLYLDLGLSLLKLGEEARVPLAEFSLEGSVRKGLRYTQRRLEKAGCRLAVQQPQQVTVRLPELKEISDDWLEQKNTREKGFSLGRYDPDYIRRNPVAVVLRNGDLLAFANLWPGGQMEELSVDLMRFRSDAPDGIIEYLFVQTMLWGKQQGYRWFNLGMAPLAGLEDHTLAPFWNRLAGFIARHGEHFYNFQGLRQYKNKFDPVWRPKYLASPGGLALPRVFANLATLISGSIRGAVAK
jgi:phosphatidylglycerol lysyltransferase